MTAPVPARFPRIALVGRHGSPDVSGPLAHLARLLQARGHPGLRWAIARTVLVYGLAHDMSRSNLILRVKKSLEAGQTIRVVFMTPGKRTDPMP